MSAQMLFGVDLGGTKIEVVAVDETGAVRARIRKPTEREKGYEHILGRIRELLDEVQLAAGERARAIGVAIPGCIDPRSLLVRGSNTPCLNDKPLDTDLERVLGIPVKTENDANCFAIAEYRLGAARGYDSAFGVILGTGVGGYPVFGASTRKGAQGIAGEWGHNPLEHEGASCYCGKQGCVETVISGPALERFYLDRSGVARGLPEIEELAAKGDPIATATINRLVENFGRALGTVINIIDPDVVVLGGGVSNVERLYTDGVESVKKWIFNPNPEVRIVKNALGDSAGVFGAAMLVSSMRQ